MGKFKNGKVAGKEKFIGEMVQGEGEMGVD